MNLSANTLFHFTKKQEYLVGILENGFSPRYSIEDMSYTLSYENRRAGVKSKDMITAIPMSCFCDIRLTQTTYHAERYGKFAIGMTKSWGMENTITPLCYFHIKSAPTVLYADITSTLRKIHQEITGSTLEQIAQGKDKANPHVVHLSMASAQLFAWSIFFKPISGKEIINGEEQEVYYYDEREWRYVPSYPLHNGPSRRLPQFAPMLFPEQFENENLRNSNQKILSQHYSLHFKEDDIKYIILPNPSYLIGFKEAFSKSNSRLNFDLLAPKIRFYTEIEEDQ